MSETASIQYVIVQPIYTGPHDPDAIFHCEICLQKFTEQQLLTEHQKTHIIGEHYDCNICHKSFKTEEFVKEHLKTHDLPSELQNNPENYQKFEDSLSTPIKCEELLDNDKFNEANPALSKSSKPIKTQKLIDTSKYIKSRKISKNSNLLIEKTFARATALKCTVCQKCFENEKYLNRHVRTRHKGMKLFFRCKFCGESAPKSRFVHHKPNCSNQIGVKSSKHKNPSENGVGDRRFTNKEELYSCNACQKSFPKSSLNEHYQREHQKSASHTHSCKFCRIAFSNNDNLKRHFEMVHFSSEGKNSSSKLKSNSKSTDEATTQLPKSPLPNNDKVDNSQGDSVLKSRRNCPSYICQYCSKQYFYQTSFERHVDTHKEKVLNGNSDMPTTAETVQAGQIGTGVGLPMLETQNNNFMSTTTFFILSGIEMPKVGNPSNNNSTVYIKQEPIDDDFENTSSILCDSEFSLSNTEIKTDPDKLNNCSLFECATCNLVFESESKFNFHMSIHLGVSSSD